MAPDKCEYIRRLARHVNVLSEVSSKDEHLDLTPAEWVEAINLELEAGALSVITEARESGTVGIYESNGEIRDELVLEIMTNVPKEKLIWEAPMKNQQARFIKSFGANINLGNIEPDDVIPVEALRCGLRADTFATFAPRTDALPLEIPEGLSELFTKAGRSGRLRGTQKESATRLRHRRRV